jgi:hypothetical protein
MAAGGAGEASARRSCKACVGQGDGARWTYDVDSTGLDPRGDGTRGRCMTDAVAKATLGGDASGQFCNEVFLSRGYCTNVPEGCCYGCQLKRFGWFEAEDKCAPSSTVTATNGGKENDKDNCPLQPTAITGR